MEDELAKQREQINEMSEYEIVNINSYLQLRVYKALHLVICHVYNFSISSGSGSYSVGNISPFFPDREIDGCLYINTTNNIAYAWVNSSSGNLTVKSPSISGKLFGELIWTY